MYYSLISSMKKAPLSTLNTGVFAVYKAESNANDSLLNYNGTPMGGLTYTTGKNGNAFQFNGTTSYVNLPNTSNEFNFTEDFTISTWVNVTLATKTQIFFGNYANGGTYGYGYTFTIVGSRIGLELRNGNTIGIYATPTSAIAANTWNNITVVRKVGQNTKIYVNGTLSSGSYTNGNNTVAPTYTASNACRMGYLLVGASSIYSDCKQDETAIWNRELTAIEATELYNSGLGKFYPY